MAAGTCAALLPGSTESAIANGDTRTLSLYHAHTHESITATFLVDGQYDQAVLDKLNWFLRDWRRDEPTKMDPRLFDTVWEVYRESGSQQPIEVMSAYRSPETNAMLRARSRQVAEHSQHILGKAMDQHYMDVPMSRIRELGMKLQRGGVGFYPTAGTPFVHLDVGGVRHWPRMSYDQLSRLFPDGKTVHIPSNGQPLAHYEEARAELEARGDGSYPTASQLKSKGFFAWLFGGGGTDEDEDNAAAGVREKSGGRQRVASLGGGATDVGHYGKNDSGSSFFAPPRVLFGSAAPVVAARPAPPPPEPPPVAPPPPATVAAVPAAPTVVPPVPATPPAALAEAPIKSLPVVSPLVMPLPPRRPVELAALGPVAPLPPLRPADLAGGQPSGASPHDSSKVARLPDLIAQGNGKLAGKVLGYAAPLSVGPSPSASIPLPVSRPVDLLSAHLDRSNFRSLTRPEATDRVSGHSALGAVLPPLRPAVTHVDLGALIPPRPIPATTFQARATDLTTNRFSGSLAKPTAQVRGAPSRTDVD